MEYPTWNRPSLKALRCPQVTFSDIDLDSSCAKEDMIVISSSPFESKVYMFSFSKKHSTPCSLSFLIVTKVSTVFLAKRDIDLVTIKSTLPSSASAIILLKPSRFFVDVPVTPSSV